MGLINIASHLPLSVRLFEPHPDPEKPGNSPALRSIVLPSKRHLGSSPSVVRGIDEDAFNAWKGANEQHPWLKDNLISVISDEEADKLADSKDSYGWEPGLESLDATDAETGSLQGDVDHTMVDMKAYSDVPSDDSPRSQTVVPGPVVPTPPPMDPEPPQFGDRLRGDPVVHGDSPHAPVETEHDHEHEHTSDIALGEHGAGAPSAERKPRFDPETGKPID